MTKLLPQTHHSQSCPFKSQVRYFHTIVLEPSVGFLACLEQNPESLLWLCKFIHDLTLATFWFYPFKHFYSLSSHSNSISFFAISWTYQAHSYLRGFAFTVSLPRCLFSQVLFMRLFLSLRYSHFSKLFTTILCKISAPVSPYLFHCITTTWNYNLHNLFIIFINIRM